MSQTKSYFFCGIGGSGMLPLASIVRAQGAQVAGSDRSLDQGRLGEKFDYLRRQGIALFDQDGSGLTSADQILVTSAAVEETVPDVQAARRLGARHLTRPQLLAELFNAAPLSIGVAGTSGKSTVTGMIGWILHSTGREPTVMNGAVMKNFASADAPFASALAGGGEAFVSEVDESDGSIALYRPRVAVLNNITLDHKSMDELHRLFLGFVDASETAVLNIDDGEIRLLTDQAKPERLVTFSLSDNWADFYAEDIREEPLALSMMVHEHGGTGTRVPLRLQVPGRHNAANALAALAAARAAGVPLAEAAAALEGFTGLRRRFDVVGTRGGISVIDDFAHNPDKIAATLQTLHAFPGRLLVFFQPHGFGPLRVMGKELVACFGENLAEEDVLVMPDPVYFGGTVERTVGSEDIVEGVRAAGRNAEYIPDRSECGWRLSELAREGDKIVIMGARDDTLSIFARDVLAQLGTGVSRPGAPLTADLLIPEHLLHPLVAPVDAEIVKSRIVGVDRDLAASLLPAEIVEAARKAHLQTARRLSRVLAGTNAGEGFEARLAIVRRALARPISTDRCIKLGIAARGMSKMVTVVAPRLDEIRAADLKTFCSDLEEFSFQFPAFVKLAEPASPTPAIPRSAVHDAIEAKDMLAGLSPDQMEPDLVQDLDCLAMDAHTDPEGFAAAGLLLSISNIFRAVGRLINKRIRGIGKEAGEHSDKLVARALLDMLVIGPGAALLGRLQAALPNLFGWADPLIKAAKALWDDLT